MKIAVTSTGPTLEYSAGARVGHCQYLLIIDPDTMDYEIMQNPVVARACCWESVPATTFAKRRTYRFGRKL